MRVSKGYFARAVLALLGRCVVLLVRVCTASCALLTNRRVQQRPTLQGPGIAATHPTRPPLRTCLVMVCGAIGGILVCLPLSLILALCWLGVGYIRGRQLKVGGLTKVFHSVPESVEVRKRSGSKTKTCSQMCLPVHACMFGCLSSPFRRRG